MLELTGIGYRYAGYANEVLHDIDLRLADGEIVGLVGPNEAGKSTLCLVASGLAPASVGGSLRGTLTLDGTPAAGLATHDLADRVVVGFQNPNTQRSWIAASVLAAAGSAAAARPPRSSTIRGWRRSASSGRPARGSRRRSRRAGSSRASLPARWRTPRDDGRHGFRRARARRGARPRHPDGG